jgi:glutathione S-transferase
MIVHWMLEELGVAYETVILDLETEQHKTDDYLAINPMGKVPALVHGDVVITECGAICAYLADAFPASNLSVPLGDPQRGAYLRWLFFATVTADAALGWAMLGDMTKDLEYQPFADIDTVAATLNDAVTGKQFIAADHFTAADVMVGSMIMWGTQLMKIMPAHEALMAYWQGLEQRPAWQRAQAQDNDLLAEKSS